MVLKFKNSFKCHIKTYKIRKMLKIRRKLIDISKLLTRFKIEEFISEKEVVLFSKNGRGRVPKKFEKKICQEQFSFQQILKISAKNMGEDTVCSKKT